VKKYLLLLLGVSSFFLASAGESQSPVDNKSGTYYFSKQARPHTELNLSGQTELSTPIQRAVKKLPGGGGITSTFLTGYTCHTQVLHIVSKTLYAKRYLSHIYPSHHFW
jgi:hypothetical protein